MSTDKPWVKNYPEGTPDQLEFDPKTLVTLLDDAESEYPESLAFANFGTSITTKEVEIKSKQFAAYLQKDLGLKRGSYRSDDAQFIAVPSCYIRCSQSGFDRCER